MTATGSKKGSRWLPFFRTKIVCSGNLAQIDSNYLSPVTSGLTYIVERFKDFDGSANIFLNGVVRSRLASFAEENL